MTNGNGGLLKLNLTKSWCRHIMSVSTVSAKCVIVYFRECQSSRPWQSPLRVQSRPLQSPPPASSPPPGTNSPPHNVAPYEVAPRHSRPPTKSPPIKVATQHSHPLPIFAYCFNDFLKGICYCF